MMRLTDRVEILEQGPPIRDSHGNAVPGPLVSLGKFRANVSYQTVSAPMNGLSPTMVEQLRAVIAPRDFDTTKHRIRWNGKLYMNDGPPMVRRRNGKTHHLTIPLKIAT